MTDADSLLAQGENAIAVVERYVDRSEERRDFREGCGRKLSHQHIAQLIDLRQRLDALIDPPKATEALRREFEELSARLEGIT